MPIEPDGLYEEYRVFKEPADVSEHPVPLHHEPTYDPATYEGPIGWMRDRQEGSVHSILPRALEEVEAFIFPLKPDNDVHARVAIAAYAESVRGEKPQLASDLRDVLDSLDEMVPQMVDATMNFERLGNGGGK